MSTNAGPAPPRRATGSAPDGRPGAGGEAAVAAERLGPLGLGMLWRPETAHLVRDEVERGRLGLVEVIAESLSGGLPASLEAAREAGATVVPHGVGLGLGGAGRPDPKRLARLARAAELCGAPLVSEHIAFVRSGGVEAGHLLPIPNTREMLDVLVANVRQAVDALPVPLALEPIATLAEWPSAEMSEVELLTELLDRTPVNLLLDLANLHVNAANRRRAGGQGTDVDPVAILDELPLDRIAYVHVAGGRVQDGRHHDTHADPLWPEVEPLVEELWARHEPPGLLLERDGGRPGDQGLRDELDALEAAATRGRRRRERGERQGGAEQRPPSDGAEDASPAERVEPVGPVEPVGRVQPVGPVQPVGRVKLVGRVKPVGRFQPVEPVQPVGRVQRVAQRAQPQVSDEARARLGDAQSALLRSLSTPAAPPAGFDRSDVDAVADVLAHKRAREVRRVVPDMAATSAFRQRFVAWAREHPLTSGGAVWDAVRFFRSLPPHERTSFAALAVTEAALHAPQRRGPGRRRRRGRPVQLRVRFHRGPRTTAVGVRVGRRQRVFCLGSRPH